MHTNDHQTRDYSAVLDKKYGAVGFREREQFEEEAWNFYSGQIQPDARKEVEEFLYGSKILAAKAFARHL